MKKIFVIICSIFISYSSHTLASIKTSCFENLKPSLQINFTGQSVCLNKSSKVVSTYLNGRKNGWSKTFYENGNLLNKAYYVNNKINGILATFYSSGLKDTEVYFIDGAKGNYMLTYKNGMKVAETISKDKYIKKRCGIMVVCCKNY
jgi:antitoxin component YwqK of YwqJK toxin-antitoxin module